MLQTNWQTICPTEAELILLQELKENPDPTTRLKVISNGKTYYQILKQWICYQWHIALNEVGEEFKTAHNDFTNAMAQLTEDYERDTTLWLELKKGMDNVFSI